MAGFDISSQSVFAHQIQPQLTLVCERETPNQIPSNRCDERVPNPNESSNGAAPKKRGRPLGAKNKAKHPMMITQESPNAIRAHLLEVHSGCDVLESLVAYTRRGQQGISVLSAVGRVTSVTLRDPSDDGAGILPLHGQFEIMSLSGTILPPHIMTGATSLAVYLAGGQARVVGGNVVGPLIACGTVIVIAAAFTFVACERLPIEINGQQVENEQPFSGDGIVGSGENYILGSTSRFPFFDTGNSQLQVVQWTTGQALC